MKRKPGFPALAGAGWLVGCVLLLLLSALMTTLIEKGVLPYTETVVTAGTLVIVGLSGLAGSLFTGLTVSKGALPGAVLCAALLLLTLCIGNGVLEKGSFHRFVPSVILLLGSGVIAGLIGARKKPTYH